MGKTVQAEDLFSTKFYDFINELEDLYYLDNEWSDYLNDMGIDTIDWTISEIIEGK